MQDIELSIITGTYNRLPHLRAMISSARASIGVGIPYEFVVVDGGSTDRSIQWLDFQGDVKLIQHGKLLGAVKAFNDGARAASGRYVILANDDIEFLYDSIPSALSFMHDHPLCGVGCFYQDRNHQAWHVENMPAVYHGKQVSVPYGQVCIIPRYLGDKVGWWGDYLHTYGGDNELSSKVYELGHRCVAMPCTWITDKTPNDELRKANHTEDLYSGGHPDTRAWVDRWTSNNMIGPDVTLAADATVPVDMERLLRIFYAPIYEPGHIIQKVSKKGLRKALAKKGLVYEYDYMNYTRPLMDTACAWDADLFVMQIQDHNTLGVDIIRRLRKQHPKAIFVNWNGDYHPGTLNDDEYILLCKEFDVVGLVCDDTVDKYKECGVNAFYWQVGFEEADIVPDEYDDKYDVVFMGNGYSQERLELVAALQSLDCKVGIFGSYPSYVQVDGHTLYDFSGGAKIYRNSKIVIGDSQWPDARGFVSNRLFQAMASGPLMLHQTINDSERLLGLKDGVHYVCWKDFDDLRTKIQQYLVEEEVRLHIAEEGQQFVLAHHSFDARVKELWETLGWS